MCYRHNVMRALIISPKTLVVIIAMVFLASFTSSAQYYDGHYPADSPGTVIRSHGKLVFDATNEYLAPFDVSATFWKEYESAVTMQHVGRYIWMAGAGCVIIGGIWAGFEAGNDMDIDMDIPGGSKVDMDMSDNGYVVPLVAGGVLGIVGVALDYAGWRKLGKLARKYNDGFGRSYSVDVGLGPTPSGFGLSVRF